METTTMLIFKISSSYIVVALSFLAIEKLKWLWLQALISAVGAIFSISMGMHLLFINGEQPENMNFLIAFFAIILFILGGFLGMASKAILENMRNNKK